MFEWFKKLFRKNEKELFIGEADANLSRPDGNEVPEGWTDDMTIPLPQGVTEEVIVELVISSALEGNSDIVTNEKIISLGINENDADLARDRVFGGIVRGATKNPDNCPIKEKDPFAWLSYQKTKENMSLAQEIYPEFFKNDKN